MQTSATRNSLVVLDELGRGTATSDGQAIAYVESFIVYFVVGTYCYCSVYLKYFNYLQGIRT